MAYTLQPKTFNPLARDTYTSQKTPYGQQDFNDLYDVSDDESEDVPITIALSPVNTRLAKACPTLDIPSPSAWPSIHKLQRSNFDHTHLSPIITAARHELSRSQKRSSIHSNSSDAPSLDSMSSEELLSNTCPSTPDRESKPFQLNPSAIRTLDRLLIPVQEQSFVLQPMEMKQVGGSLDKISTEFEIAMTPIEAGDLSAISIPSPGGFFASLESNARDAWLPSPSDHVETSIAENFYGVPFEQVVSSAASDYTDGPPTARQIPAHWNCGTPGLQALRSPNFQDELHDYNTKYENQIRASSGANIDRTASWLQQQGGLSGETDESDIESPDSPETAPKDTLLFRSYEHIQNSKNASDAFVHRKTRSEKLRLDRKCLFSSHVNQLEGKYTVSTPQPVTAIKLNTPKLDTVTEEPESEKEVFETAIREQNALQQLEPVSWNVEATKFLNGGTLLTSPTGRTFTDKPNARILDLGGVTSCDWSWQVALEHPRASVHNVYTAGTEVNKSISTPANFRLKEVPNLWTLPFPDNYFDCISARNLYSLLRLDKVNNKHTGVRADEYDLTLAECLRVLRPGGYLEFALLDADLMNAGRFGGELSLRFAMNLKARGYDSAPTKAWLPRLRKAGFGHIRRAWLVLPTSVNGSNPTAEASHITGMVGSWAWERWMLKLQKELGLKDDSILEGVSAALEEGATTGASWRYLSGWARKPMDV